MAGASHLSSVGSYNFRQIRDWNVSQQSNIWATVTRSSESIHSQPILLAATKTVKNKFPLTVGSGVQRHSPLLRLPSELRIKILILALCSSGPIRVFGGGPIRNPLGNRGNLLLVSRQIYAEAKPICYSKTIIMFVDDRETNAQAVKTFTEAVGEIADHIEEARLLIMNIAKTNLTRNSVKFWTRVSIKKNSRTSRCDVELLSDLPDPRLFDQTAPIEVIDTRCQCLCDIRRLAEAANTSSPIQVVEKYMKIEVLRNMVTTATLCEACGMLRGAVAAPTR